jgi:hypothetical protein
MYQKIWYVLYAFMEGFMKRCTSLIAIILLAAELLSACNLVGLTNPAAPDMNSISTSAAQTIVAMSVQLTSLASIATQTSPAATATPEQSLTNTPSTEPGEASSTQQTALPGIPQVEITPIAPLPCNRADFVADISAYDGTSYSPGGYFTKTWRLRNSGSCTWTSDYDLVFDSGSAMGGPATLSLPGAVAPGQLIDLSVNLQAPLSNGSYLGYWKLQDAAGVRFGYGANSASPFWVRINVGPTPVPISVIVEPTEVDVLSGNCSLIEVSPPINTQYAKGGDFDSKWTVRNTSSKTWDSDHVVFKYTGGTRMYKGESSKNLSKNVKHDAKITLIVDSIAPDKAGTYSMTWSVMKDSTHLCNMKVVIIVK